MKRALLALAGLLALAPATAAAAPFGELPFTPTTGPATCLRPTGTPGELVRWTSGGAELLQASATGLAPVASIPLGELRWCPLARTYPGGAGVVANNGVRGLRAAVRDPGAAFGAPVTLSRRGGGFAVAASARGDAVVAWIEYVGAPRDDRVRVRVARRAPGAAFGKPEVVVPDARDYDEIEAVMTGDGEAFLAMSDRRGVRLTSARPGVPFPRPRRIVRTTDDGFGLAANPDGRVLLAVPGMNRIDVFEREPGADFVQRPSLEVGSTSAVALALRPDGGAIIAWQNGGQGDLVLATMRDGVAPFGAPIRVAEAEHVPGRSGAFSILSDGPPVEDSPELRVAFGADGRALLAWAIEQRGGRLATVTSAGVAERQEFGGRVRDAVATTPLLLGDGTRAVAWVDNNHTFSVPPYAGRLHLAVEGAAGAPAAPPPQVTLGAPRDRSLRPSQSLVLPVRCSAACDIRAQVGNNEESASLASAGTHVLRFDPLFEAIAPRRPGAVRVRLSWSAPGGRESAARTVSVRLRRLPPPPLPRLQDIRTQRRPGGIVDVRWTTDVPAVDAVFYVYGTRTRGLDDDDRPAFRIVAGGPRRKRFRVRLRDAGAARYVHVGVFQLPSGRRQRVERVRIGQ